MKKNAIVSAIALVILVVGIIILTACNNHFDPAVPAETTVSTVSPDTTDVSCSEAIEMFRANPRTSLNGYMLNEGYLYGINYSTPIDSIHNYGLNIPGQTLARNSMLEVAYDKDTNTLYVCRLGNSETVKLPAGTTFCGVNDEKNVICRSGSDVYLLDINADEPTFEHIASDVEYVISTNYSYTHDVDSAACVMCPLFLMKDGTLKVYTDEDFNLCSPLYEGGWVDTSPIS